jgi:hypothetical protein
MRGFVERAGLAVVACRTDVVRRDAITFLRSSQRCGAGVLDGR